MTQTTSDRPKEPKAAAGVGWLAGIVAVLTGVALFAQDLVPDGGAHPAAGETFPALLRKTAEQGDAKAQFVLAGLYTFGDGVAKDDAEAARWYRKAAERGHVFAQFMLGGMYASGEGVRMDDGEAVLWWRKAAEQGFADAQFKLGLMYSVGEGVPKDEVQAYVWMNLAAAQGHESAREIRAGLSGHMSRAEIAEAQKLRRELAD